MIPVIIAAAAGAVVGGVAVAALSDDDRQPSGEQQTKRIISESQLPSAVKNKLEKKRRDKVVDNDIAEMLSRC